MSEPNAIDSSDAKTGLPPLTEIEDGRSVYVTDYSAQEGTMGGLAFVEPVPVRWLSVRGFTAADKAVIAGGGPIIEWRQHHIAIHANNAIDVAASLAGGLTVEPDGSTSQWLDALQPCAKVLADRIPALRAADGQPDREAVNTAMALLIEARSVMRDR